MTLPEKAALDTEYASRLAQNIVKGFENFKKGNHYAYGLIGGALLEMAEGKKYKALGYKNMDAFIDDLGRSRSICYSMMDYAKYIVPLSVNNNFMLDLDVTFLTKETVPLVRKCLKDERETVDLLEKLQHIASQPSDYAAKDEIRALAGKVRQLDCPHEETEPWSKCKTCGRFLKNI